MADPEIRCPICDSVEWSSAARRESFEYKGQTFFVDGIQWSVCGECGFELVLPEQSRANEARIRNRHREIDGLLTGEQIKAIRERLHLTQAQAAELFGGGTNAFSKYERGEVTQSVAMDRLLHLAAADPETIVPFLARLSSGPDTPPAERMRLVAASGPDRRTRRRARPVRKQLVALGERPTSKPIDSGATEEQVVLNG